MADHTDEVERDEGPGQGERVAKALARAGVASRREVERYIADGRVALNGQVLTTPAVKVGPGDVLTVDGKVVGEPEGVRVWRYHKPVGLLTTHNDPGGRPTVFEALPKGLPRVISVGRLDLNSEGLLLLTNDGAVARALELPSTGWIRRYRARAYGQVTQARLDELKNGITVEGVRYGAIDARLDKLKEGATGANVWITVAISEGKNREVRRVLEALGLKVNRLIRLAYGPFQLGTLALGEVAEIGPRVLKEQLAPLVPGLKVADGRGSPKTAPATTSRRPTAAPQPDPAPSPEPDKKGYKPGWAKPKKRPRPPRPSVKRERPDATLNDVPAKPRSARPRPPAPSARPPSGAARRTPAAPRPGPGPKGGRGPRG